MTKDEMFGWHGQHNGHEFKQALGVGEGQGSLACFSLLDSVCWTWLSYWTIKCKYISFCKSVTFKFTLLLSPDYGFSYYFFFIYFYFYFFICGGFCHTLKWNSHGFTCVPHPNPPSHLPLHPFPLGFPSAPGLSTCLMHPTWAGDLFHPRLYTCFNAVLLKHPTLAFSHRV